MHLCLCVCVITSVFDSVYVGDCMCLYEMLCACVYACISVYMRDHMYVSDWPCWLIHVCMSVGEKDGERKRERVERVILYI